jgi:hypothetical protein
MKVRNALAGGVSGVDDNPIPVLSNLHLVRHFGGSIEKMPKQGHIQLGSVVERLRIVLARDQEHVNWRLGIRIFYGNDLLVLVDDLGRYVFGNDATKDTALFDVFHNVFDLKPIINQRSQLSQTLN